MKIRLKLFTLLVLKSYTALKETESKKYRLCAPMRKQQKLPLLQQGALTFKMHHYHDLKPNEKSLGGIKGGTFKDETR